MKAQSKERIGNGEKNKKLRQGLKNKGRRVRGERKQPRQRTGQQEEIKRQ